jgi:hypothetical protein
MAKLSPTQEKVLEDITQRYIEKVRSSLDREGSEVANHAAERGVNVSDLPLRTLRALRRKGAIVVTEWSVKPVSVLRLGPFGRWLGGTRTEFFAFVIARPNFVA